MACPATMSRSISSIATKARSPTIPDSPATEEIMDRFYTEDQKALRDTARRFAEAEILPRADAIDREDRFDRSLYKSMAELGLFGICLREGAGGAGLDAVAACITMEELARCSGAVANAFAIPVEAALFFDQHGGDQQKALIPGILNGSIIP